MAVIRIFEMSTLPSPPVLRRGQFVASHDVTIAAASDQSAAFSSSTNYVSIQADAACHVVFGEDPTATTAGFKIQSGETADFGVTGGHKVAVIEA